VTARKAHRHVDQDRYLEVLHDLETGAGELDDFAEHFDVSPATARRKLDGLFAQGLAERLPARGRGPLYRLAPLDPGDHPDADRPPGTSGSWGEA